jgi:AraC-like DNA-binding protein
MDLAGDEDRSGHSSDAVNRAHLTGAHAPSPPIYRYPRSNALADVVRSYWIPVWDLPDGVVQTQGVLQYPVCLIVVASDYARFYGVKTGLSNVDLQGSGWAFGVMLQPVAGRLVLQQPIETVTDSYLDLAEVPGINGVHLRDRIHEILVGDPTDTKRHAAAIEIMESELSSLLPINDDGRIINEIVDLVESDRTIVSVEQLAAESNVSERTLQRLTRDQLGLSPKWLIQRRRLHDAVEHLKTGGTSLTDLATNLGYTDQAHFTSDFRRATGMTPGAYLSAQHRS